MPMEREAKFSVPGFAAVRRALRAAGARYRGTVMEFDRFFDTPDRGFYRSGCGLRLRRVRVLRGVAGARQAGWLLTHKGPADGAAKAKVRHEVQTHVEDGLAMDEILRAAGLGVFMEIEKRRASYRLGRCLVELDELPLLGAFVEIEAPRQRDLEAARRKLQLSGPAITESYLELAARRCRRLNHSCRRLSFDGCRCCKT